MEKFIITSNYPKEEYIKYLKTVIKSAEDNYKKIKDESTKYCIDKGISEICKIIEEINNESLFYSVMDMLYAGETDKAREMCTKGTLENCLVCLNNPEGMVSEIYVFFAKKYNMKNKCFVANLINLDGEADNNEV